MDGPGGVGVGGCAGEAARRDGAVGTDGGKRGIRERSAWGVGGVVAALLNFNEYQGEFLLGFFLLSCSLYVLSPWHTHTHGSKSLSHK